MPAQWYLFSLDTPPGRALQCIVDPFAYRDRIEQPKLLIFGTNDRYWPIDACQNYWDELQGDKYLLYVPNQGHGIEDIPRVVGSLNALHQSLRGGEPLPKLSWDFETRENDVVLDVEASGSVDTVRGWIARSSNRDFRDSTWTQTAMQVGRDGTWSLQVPLPDSGAVACYAEVVTEGDQLPGFFSTNVRVFEAE